MTAKVARWGRAFVVLAGVTLCLMLLGGVQAARLASSPHQPVPAPHRSHRPPLPLAPPHGTLPGWLHSAGTQIVDAHNHPLRLASVNWYGAEGTDFVPGGLAFRPYMDVLRTIKSLGFNSIRLPFSNELVERNPIVRRHVEANPQFRDKHALDILDTILAGARQVGVMVILSDMRVEAGQSGPGHVLWYSPPRHTQQQWIDDWVVLARRYRSNPAVIGYDLYNEPHSNGPGLEILGLGYLRQGATWGPFNGSDNPATDWRLAAERAGNAILHVNPHALIIVEGVEVYPYPNPLAGSFCPHHIPATDHYCADLYWWGGNLVGARAYPVVLAVPHQLVYSPHEYGPAMHGQRWITPTMTARDWQDAIDQHWGYLLAARGLDAAPVYVGEFGTPSVADLSLHDAHGGSQGAWFSALVAYLQRNPSVGWAYWPVNGTRPGERDRRHARAEPYGLLSADWAHLAHPQVWEVLRTLEK